MRKLAIFALGALLLCGCGTTARQPKVMARYVPERADDFVFENNLVCGRIYGKALEGDPTSPGIDIWVKTPGALVADQRYHDELVNHISYHKDHGNGKDCYKVSVSLGGGASSPIIDGNICYPATNYRSYEILEQSAKKVVFVLHYPEWEAAEGIKVALDKKITVVPDTYFLQCTDTYTFSGTDKLDIAVGVNRHKKQNTIVSEKTLPDRYLIWEHASDTGAEPEEGLLGVGVVLPGADKCGLFNKEKHGGCIKKIASGEPLTYWFGSCWSKGDVKTAEQWFEIGAAVK